MTHLKVALTLTILAPVLALSQAPEDVAGHWEGEIELPGQPLVVRVDLENGGVGWTGTIDIPAQGATGIALSNIEVTTGDEGVQVGFTMSGVPGDPTFDGRLSDDGTIRGTFSQGAARLGFRLSRDTVAGPVRPQEPREPFPYEVEDASFANGEVRLAGTLTVPEGTGPFPAALLISGSGGQDRNEEIFGHKPFWVLADHLTRAGIAVLRVDDPGVGESTAHANPPTTADFADDVAAGVAYLKGDPRIDPERIGLIGHSEGGAIAPLVASRSDDVGFLVLLAGPGVPGDELLRKQNERIFDAAGIRGERKAKLLALLDRLFAALVSDLTQDELRAEVTEIVRVQLEANGIPPDRQNDAQVRAAAEPALSPWMRYFLTYDPRPALERTTVPVLALNGDLDLQVDAEQNLTAIAAALRGSGNDDVVVHRLPGLNHLFQHAKTGLINEYGTIEETMSPEVLDLIRDFILAIASGGRGSHRSPASLEDGPLSTHGPR